MYDSLAKMTAMGSKPKGKKDTMDREAKRDAIVAARKKAGNKTPSGDMSYEEVQRLKKSGKFKGMDFSGVGVKG
jgi:hypothetical protein